MLIWLESVVVSLLVMLPMITLLDAVAPFIALPVIPQKDIIAASCVVPCEPPNANVHGSKTTLIRSCT